VLSQARDPQTLRTEVRQMRATLRRSLVSGQAGRFHLKQVPVGIADIEFLVQFGVLRWSAEHPTLLDWTDNIRLLETLADCGRLPQDSADALAEAYRAFRKETHRLALEDLPPLIAGDAFTAQRQAVCAQWQQWLHSEAKKTQP